VRTGDPAALLPALREKSEARVAASEDFATLERKIAERHRMEDQREVSLVLTDRRAEHEAVMKAIGEDDATNGAEEEDDDEDQYVLDEALAVLVDYTEGLKGR
jgi:hypothetical protein